MSVFSKILNPFALGSRPLATLRGHGAAVLSISFSPNGKYVASGGNDGVIIWDTSTWKAIPIAKQSYVERAQVTSVCWVTRRHEAIDTLCYGNVHGFLVFLQYTPGERRFETVLTNRVAQGNEIISIASRVSGTDIPRIAVCTRDRCLQVWRFDTGSWKLTPVFSKKYSEPSVLPRLVAFDNNPDYDVFVFGLYDGNLYKHNGNTAELIYQCQLTLQIGHAAVDPDHRLCAVDNVGDGFNLYKLDTGSFISTLTTKDPIKTHPKGVAFASQTRFVVGGSDHGLVYVFDRRTGNMVTTLRYARAGGAETVAAYDANDGTILIAAASSTSVGPTQIKIWKWTPIPQDSMASGLSTMDVVSYMLKVFVFVAACAYFCELGMRQYNLRWATDTTATAPQRWIPWNISRWSDL